VMAEGREEGTSSEVYIVTRLNIDCNVKLREDRLDVKVLEARSGLLELWKPLLSAELPISVPKFKQEVAAHLGVEPDRPSASYLSENALRDLANSNPALAWTPLHKKRVRFEISSGWAEVVYVTLGDRHVQSVCVEAIAADVAHELVAAAGLATYRNESYPCFLQAIAFG